MRPFQHRFPLTFRFTRAKLVSRTTRRIGDAASRALRLPYENTQISRMYSKMQDEVKNERMSNRHTRLELVGDSLAGLTGRVLCVSGE